jgi:hypothetical protein
MEIRHRLLQIHNTPQYDLLIAEFNRFGCKYKYNENSFLSSIEYTFSEHEPYASDLLKFANANKIMVQSALYYDEQEILSAEWVIAEVGEFQYPQPEDSYIETTYNTQDYCGRCGQGVKQDRPFRLKKDFVQRQAKFLGLHWVFDEIFIRPEVRHIFDAHGISGVKYRDVIHHKTGEPITNVLQLDIPILEEKGLVIENLFSVTCKPHNEESHVKGLGIIKERPGLPYCGRVKYHYPLTIPFVFKASVLKGFSSFVKSYEYFGSGAAAHHFILVHNDVVRLVKENGLKGLGIRRPVHFV